MGFSSQKYRKEEQERGWEVHPIWRGIGCALIILIPIMSWYAATLFLQTNKRVNLPAALTSPLTIRYFGVYEVDQIIAKFNHFTVSNHLLTGQFFLTIILIFIGFGILSLIYATMFRVAGPSRYGPFDVPPDMMRK